MTRSADARRRRLLMQMRAESAGFFGVLTAGSADTARSTALGRADAADAGSPTIEQLLERLLAEAPNAVDRVELVRRYAALIEAARLDEEPPNRA